MALKSAEKFFTLPFNLAFFMLLFAKSSEILPRHNRYAFISESFALN